MGFRKHLIFKFCSTCLYFPNFLQEMCYFTNQKSLLSVPQTTKLQAVTRTCSSGSAPMFSLKSISRVGIVRSGLCAQVRSVHPDQAACGPAPLSELSIKGAGSPGRARGPRAVASCSFLSASPPAPICRGQTGPSLSGGLVTGIKHLSGCRRSRC